MKKFFVSSVLILFLFLLMTCSAHGEIFEASGHGKVPATSETLAQGIVLARRGAIVDLQRNLLMKINHGHFSSGIIRGIVITSEVWDGYVYTVTGYVKR